MSAVKYMNCVLVNIDYIKEALLELDVKPVQIKHHAKSLHATLTHNNRHVSIDITPSPDETTYNVQLGAMDVSQNTLTEVTNKIKQSYASVVLKHALKAHKYKIKTTQKNVNNVQVVATKIIG